MFYFEESPFDCYLGNALGQLLPVFKLYFNVERLKSPWLLSKLALVTWLACVGVFHRVWWLILGCPAGPDVQGDQLAESAHWGRCDWEWRAGSGQHATAPHYQPRTYTHRSQTQGTLFIFIYKSSSQKNPLHHLFAKVTWENFKLVLGFCLIVKFAWFSILPGKHWPFLWPLWVSFIWYQFWYFDVWHCVTGHHLFQLIL